MAEVKHDQSRLLSSFQPLKSESADESDDKLKVMTYERTPVMSTYLLAFVVGEYDYVEANDSDGVKVRVYTPVGKKEQGQFALEVSLQSLLWLRVSSRCLLSP